MTQWQWCSPETEPLRQIYFAVVRWKTTSNLTQQFVSVYIVCLMLNSSFFSMAAKPRALWQTMPMCWASSHRAWFCSFICEKHDITHYFNNICHYGGSQRKVFFIQYTFGKTVHVNVPWMEWIGFIVTIAPDRAGQCLFPLGCSGRLVQELWQSHLVTDLSYSLKPMLPSASRSYSMTSLVYRETHLDNMSSWTAK